MVHDEVKMAIDPNPSNRIENLLSYFEILVRRRWIALGVFSSIFILTLVYLLTVTPVYTATTTILPPVESKQSGISIIAEQFINVPQTKGLNTPPIYREILSSRPLILNVLKRKFRSEKTGEEALLIDILDIQGNTPYERFEMGYEHMVSSMVFVMLTRQTGITALSVESTEPQLSADIANALVEELNTFTLSFISEKASKNRIFIESRLEETDSLLRKAEEELKAFRKTNKRIEKSPELQLEYGRHLRQVKMQEEVFLTLNKEREIVRIEEVKDMPLINVLNMAVAPLKKSRPARIRIAIVMAILAAVTGIAMAFLADKVAIHRSNDKVMRRLHSMLAVLRNDYVGLRWRLLRWRRKS